MEHYTVHVSITAAAIFLVGLSVGRVFVELVENIGNAFWFLLFSFIGFELFRSLRLQENFRLRAYNRIANNAVIASFAVILLNWLGQRILEEGGHFFSPIAGKVIGCVLVASVLWRTVLSMTTIRKILAGIRSDVLMALTRRSLRRQLAALVAGSSYWTLIFSYVLILFVMSHATRSMALFAATQAFFLACCWRWGYLESHA